MCESYRLLELDRLLEFCSQEASSELGRNRVLNSEPLEDIETVRKELNLVGEMVRLLEETSFPIQGLRDVSAAIKKLEPTGGVLDRDEYLPLRDMLTISTGVKKFFLERKEGFEGLKVLASQLGNFRDLITQIDKVFDINGEIKDSASPDLRRIRRQKDGETQRLHKTLEVILERWNKQKMTQEDSLSWRGNRLLIPVKAEHRGRAEGVVQDESSSGATVFVEPLEAVTIGNAIRRLENEEIREINRLLAELCDKIRTRLPEISTSLEILSQFDHIYARARFARRLKCTCPTMTDDPYLKLVEAKHPLLALKSQREAFAEGVKVVPLTLTLGGEEGSILVITGPNAGGKTVALKTVGLLCLMASCGLHVPAADGTTLPMLGAVHCDIGDPQSLDQDLSTFSSHMLRLKSLLEDERRPKLVLLDEIGASTDPAEGSAIARAALSELRRQGALAVVTTHQGTLKVFAHETNGIFNGSMEFDQKTLRPTFRFRAGLPGSSYALEISERVGLPMVLLSTARQLLGEETNRLEDLLARLNESLRLSEEARRYAELKFTEQEALSKLYRQRLDELSKSQKEKLRQAAQEAKKLLDEANRRVESAVKAIREQEASRESIKAAHEVIKQEKEKIEQTLERTALQPDRNGAETFETPGVQVGDWVKLEGLKEPVRVLALRKNGEEAKLEVGGVHLWMDTFKLKPSRPPEKTPMKTDVKVTISDEARSRPGYELDLRGMTGEEAVFAVEKYLSDCAVSGWKSVRIIHGKGTGVLRARVRELLERYPDVKSYRYGRPEEGEFGVTIVELK